MFGKNTITKLPADNVEIGKDVVRVTFLKGETGSKAGGLVRAAVKPCDAATVSYKVRFVGAKGKPFDFVKAGKMGPGFSFGEPGADGGHHLEHGGSARVMWRVLEDVPTAVAYIYIPNEVAGQPYKGEDSKVYAVQGPAFGKILHWTPGGDDLFRDAGMALEASGWNEVTLTVKLNDPGKKNGVIRVRVNGVEASFDSMIWRTDASLKINQLILNAWFGGSSEDYASPSNQSAEFKDIVVNELSTVS